MGFRREKNPGKNLWPTTFHGTMKIWPHKEIRAYFLPTSGLGQAQTGSNLENEKEKKKEIRKQQR